MRACVLHNICIIQNYIFIPDEVNPVKEPGDEDPLEIIETSDGSQRRYALVIELIVKEIY